MPVVQVTTWQIRAGRAIDVAGVGRARAIHERLGATAAAAQTAIAGPNANRMNYILWFADLEAFGRFSDALPADPEWQQFVNEVILDPSGFAALESNALSQDLPGTATEIPERPPAGAVLQTTAWQPAPGRLPEVLANVMEWQSIAKRHEIQTRAVQTIAGGPLTGTLTVANVFPSMTAYATASTALLADQQFQLFWQRLMAPGAAAAPLGQSLSRFLPI